MFLRVLLHSVTSKKVIFLKTAGLRQLVSILISACLRALSLPWWKGRNMGIFSNCSCLNSCITGVLKELFPNEENDYFPVALTLKSMLDFVSAWLKNFQRTDFYIWIYTCCSLKSCVVSQMMCQYFR